MLDGIDRWRSEQICVNIAPPSQVAIAALFNDRVNLFVIGGHLTMYMTKPEDDMIKIRAK